MQREFFFKILLIGDAQTGKSSILQRFSEQTFTELYVSTLGADFRIKTIQIENSEWDTSGQEHFRTFVTSYYKASHAILVVFDRTNRESFDNIDLWVDNIRRSGLPNVTLIFIGTKSDLEPQISTEEALEKAFRYQVPYIDVSSKTGDQIDIVFEIVSRILIDKEKAKYQGM